MFDFDGRAVPIEPGDSVASAAHRTGLRVFSRSVKYHRPRGLYCLSGDCPNCAVMIDGEPGICACTTPAVPGMVVRRGRGFPSPEHDVLAALWRAQPFLPVGFYYKSMIRPRWAWAVAEPLIRRFTGIGAVAPILGDRQVALRHMHPDLLIVGGGPAGLAAAAEGAKRGLEVVVAEQHQVGTLQPLERDRSVVFELAAQLRASRSVTLLEQAPVVGLYEGPVALVAAPEALVHVHARRTLVATGASERHLVCDGNDLPGVWLGRGAMRLLTAHGLAPGEESVIVGPPRETAAVVDLLSEARCTSCVAVVANDELVGVRGRRRVSGVRLKRSGRQHDIRCDTVVACLGLQPRDRLLRQLWDEPTVSPVGDVATPGLDLDAALEAGAKAGLSELPLSANRGASRGQSARADRGVVCLCEDVLVADIAKAIAEGFRSSETVKRYTTATMGPCQGTMCQGPMLEQLREAGVPLERSHPTTARPPAAPLAMATAAAGDSRTELRTRLHSRHLAASATMEALGGWWRPWCYGTVEEEYQAVRTGVSIMDVGPLGKFRVVGPDVETFLEYLYPINISTLPVGRWRYAPLLNESGYVIDDGLVCRVDKQEFYLTTSTAGAHTMAAWLHGWAELWSHRVTIVEETAAKGAIVLAGPRSRELLTQLSPEPFAADSFPFQHLRVRQVAGIDTIAIRVGFLGELAYELHHQAQHSTELWDALMAAGADTGIRPHGLAVQDLLRLEKGHIIVGQDTEFDSTPAKVGLAGLIAEKPFFVGKGNLERLSSTKPLRRLVGLMFDGADAAPAGSVIRASTTAVLGHVTSSGSSLALKRGVGLAFIEGDVKRVSAAGLAAAVVRPPFFDPGGARVRA